MNNRDSNPLNRHELDLIIKNSEIQTKHLEARLKAIVAKLIFWEDDINDARCDSVQVVLDCKGEKVRLSVRKME